MKWMIAFVIGLLLLPVVSAEFVIGEPQILKKVPPEHITHILPVHSSCSQVDRYRPSEKSALFDFEKDLYTQVRHDPDRIAHRATWPSYDEWKTNEPVHRKWTHHRHHTEYNCKYVMIDRDVPDKYLSYHKFLRDEMRCRIG